jgi:hypothetical protein
MPPTALDLSFGLCVQLIHARMYAQFAVIAGIGAAGVISFLGSETSDRRSSVKLRLTQFDPEPVETQLAPAAGITEQPDVPSSQRA